MMDSEHKLELIIHYGPGWRESPKTDWQWRNGRCTRNGTADNPWIAVARAEEAFIEWESER